MSSAKQEEKKRSRYRFGVSILTQEEDERPADKSTHISFKVKGQDGSEVYYKMNRNTQLWNFMNAHCNRQSVDFNSIYFLFDGRKLHSDQTPDEVGMEDGDEIDEIRNTGRYHEEKHVEEYIPNNTIPSSQVPPTQTQPQSPPSSPPSSTSQSGPETIETQRSDHMVNFPASGGK